MSSAIARAMKLPRMVDASGVSNFRSGNRSNNVSKADDYVPALSLKNLYSPRAMSSEENARPYRSARKMETISR